MTDAQVASIGDNSAVAFQELTGNVDAMIGAADQWLAQTAIEDDEAAGKASDFITQLRAHYKTVDGERVTEKAPFDAGAKEVQARYKPLLDRLQKAGEMVKRKLTPYLEEKERRQAEEKRQAEAEALRKMQEAEEAAKAAAEQNTVDSALAAEEAEKAEKEAIATANRAARATPKVSGSVGRTTALRTVTTGRIVDQDAVYAYYRANAKLIETLQAVVNADIRGGCREIPGVEIVTEKKAS